MNEREEFLQYFQSVVATMVERIQTMTESQVLDGLREVKAGRDIYSEELTERLKTITEAEVLDAPQEIKAARSAYSQDFDFRNFMNRLRSQSAFFNSIGKLRSQLGARARHGGSPTCLFDTIEDALNLRLERLRGNRAHWS